MTTRVAVRRSDVVAVASATVAAAVVGLLFTHGDVNSFTLQTHGDQAWVQASAQVAMQSGPFATNDHVGWSSGFNPWSFPALGSLGFYLIAWVLGVVTSSSSDVLTGIMALTSAAVAALTYLALRINVSRAMPPALLAALAFSFGASPYVLSKMGHYDVAAIYLLPAVLAFLGLVVRRLPIRTLLIAAAVLAVIALLSPLWWSLVSMFVLGWGIVVALLLRSWRWIVGVGLAWVAVAVGAAIPTALTLVNRVSTEGWNRQPWDSTLFSGSLSDVLVTSTWIQSIVPGLDTILPATAREQSAVGLVPGLAMAAAVVLALTAYLGVRDRDRPRVGWLLVGVQVTLLTFLTFGLGTFTEAVLSFAGIDFPLRVWSRLTILLALVGAVLVVALLTRQAERWRGGPVLTGVVVILVAVVTLADVRAIDLSEPRTLPSIEETAAVDYLAAEVGDCPVAQLPVGTFPDFPLHDGTDLSITYYYRGFVPYLLNPDGRWSYGAVAGSATDVLMRGLPATITPDVTQQLAEAGYCAVLFDREFAAWLGNRDPQWPGQVWRAGSPAMDGPRFAVYRL